MFMIRVKETEKALLYKNEKLIEVLDAGVHKGFFPFTHYRIEYIPFTPYGIGRERAQRLYKLYPELIKRHFHIVELEAHERAYVMIDGQPMELLEAGGLKLYFKEYTLEVEKIDIKKEYEVSQKHIDYLEKLPPLNGVKKIVIEKFAKGYLYANEEFVKILEPGKHYYYADFFDIDVKMIDMRVQELEISGQELLSADKVTLRCNLTMHYQIIDGTAYLNRVDDPREYLYKQLQFAAREHIGALKIDEILQQQHTLSKAVLQKLYEVCKEVGVEVKGVYIKDIILPGDMREIFNQVIEATKRAEANNIRRREETAATRSLLNTAKLMKDNPALARLKELEALEKITQTVGTLNIYNGFEGVMNGLIDLKGTKEGENSL